MRKARGKEKIKMVSAMDQTEESIHYDEGYLLGMIQRQRNEIGRLKGLLRNHLLIFKELLADADSTREMLTKVREIVGHHQAH